MNTERAYRILKEIAMQHGTTVERVIADIEKSINDAIATTKRTNDVNAMKQWEKIPCVGEIPTAVEFVAYLGERLAQEKNGHNAVPFNGYFRSN